MCRRIAGEGTGSSAAPDVNVVALVKGEERYIFLFHDHQKDDVLRTIGRFAGTPELSFTWYDAAKVSLRIHQLFPSAGRSTSDSGKPASGSGSPSS